MGTTLFSMTFGWKDLAPTSLQSSPAWLCVLPPSVSLLSAPFGLSRPSLAPTSRGFPRPLLGPHPPTFFEVQLGPGTLCSPGLYVKP